MTIRTYQPGDELAQVSIYNEAAGSLPKFKVATVDEVRRRIRAADFDPSARFYAVDGSSVVGYATFQANGRVSYPWCRKGYEQHAEPLFDQMLEGMKARGLTHAWAAYRGDWPTVGDYFRARGFAQTREMLNFVLDLVEMPTPGGRATASIAPLTAEDVPVLKSAAPDVLRASVADIEKAWFRNPWLSTKSLFSLRDRSTNRPVAVGAVVLEPTYANPQQVDSAMPCFRLGAFGTEGLTAKRINGLFSFFVTEPRDTHRLGLELLGHAARLIHEADRETAAAQISSDVPHLVRFYRQIFRPQGSFPIFERQL